MSFKILLKEDIKGQIIEAFLDLDTAEGIKPDARNRCPAVPRFAPQRELQEEDSYSNEPDPKRQNVTVFCDGHVKSMVTGQLTRQGKYWSLGGNNQWP